MKNMQKIAVIIPYFGKLPPFYKLWEHTALANSTIDFFLFTNTQEITSRQNINVVNLSLEEFRSILQEVFDFEISLDVPYKLCDYKPTYGLALQKWLKDYDWWGFGDIDLLLGDIRKFFHENCLNSHDKCCLLGHLSIYRNNEKLNNLFKIKEEGYPSLNYKEVYSTNDSMYFDEARGMYTKGMLTNISVYTGAPFRDPIPSARKFYHRHPSEESQFVVLWKDGKCFAVDKKNNHTELLYAHFFRRNFEILNLDVDNINTIKVLPTKVYLNEDVCHTDFDVAESIFYKVTYQIRNLLKSVKRYGIRKTVTRQKWSKDHDQYVHRLEKEYRK